jgi:hypothetical protein
MFIHQTTQHNSVNDIDSVGTPPFVEIVEQNPNGLLFLQVARDERAELLCLSDPPTANERLQLTAARILRRPIAIMPAKCLSVGEWIARFGLP